MGVHTWDGHVLSALLALSPVDLAESQTPHLAERRGLPGPGHGVGGLGGFLRPRWARGVRPTAEASWLCVPSLKV